MAEWGRAFVAEWVEELQLNELLVLSSITLVCRRDTLSDHHMTMGFSPFST